MKGIVADVDVLGHFQALLTIFRSPSWQELWTSLNLATPTFADLGLASETPDWTVWQTCQKAQLVLVTANRNARARDSLGGGHSGP